MLRFHIEQNADATLATIEVPVADGTPVRHRRRRRRRIAWSASTRSPSSRRRCPARPTSRWRRWASTSSRPTSWSARSRRTRPVPDSQHDFGKNIIPSLIQQRAGVLLPLLRREQEGVEVLARHRHARRLLRSEHGPVPGQPRVQPLRSGVAAAHLPAAGAAGQVRVRRGRAPLRPGARLGHLGRLHHLRQPRVAAASCARTCACTASATSTRRS